MRRFLLLVLSLALVTVLAACGGGPKPIPKEEYLKRADVICKKGSDDLHAKSVAAFKDVKQGEKPTDAQIADFVRQTVVPLLRQQVKELSKLPPPEKLGSQAAAIYKELNKGLDELDKDPKKLTTTNVFQKADELAKKDGLVVCQGS
jgi:hypothetical protein